MKDRITVGPLVCHGKPCAGKMHARFDEGLFSTLRKE